MNSMVLRIRKLSFPQNMMMIIFIMPFLLNALQGLFSLPSIIKYTIDVAWITALFMLVVAKRQFVHKRLLPYVIFFCVWFLYVLVIYLFHYQSVFYFLWGFRNNARYFIAFILFAYYFDKEIVSWCLKFMDVMFWINVAVTMYQFFFMGLNQDYLGGIFGVDRGCNGYSVVFFTIMVIRSLLNYMNGKESVLKCFLWCGAALVIAAMAELKFYFVLFIFVLFVSAFVTKFSWRKVLLAILAAFLITVAGSVFTSVFGESQQLSIARILELFTAESYASSEDLGRFTALPIISKQILPKWSQKVFGLGLGNCDTSSFSICNTPFFQSYQGLHYHWISSAFLFLETGYIGLTMHLAFYIMCFITAYKKMKRGNRDDLFCQIGMVMSLVCIVLVFYNSSLRTEAGYFAIFALSLPLIPNDNMSSKTLKEADG